MRKQRHAVIRKTHYGVTVRELDNALPLLGVVGEEGAYLMSKSV
jgi:hypothetical protein